MKNIFLLSTDKPSRIIKGQDNDFILLNTNAPNWFGINLKTTKQHIYITSDEEIKEGDWIYNLKTNRVDKAKFSLNLKSISKLNWRKIILTTDQDLIKDGVQAIDDEFLEWFVKNPSCEKVETVNVPYFDESGYSYLLIAPKEEPKQETLEEVPNKLDSVLAKITHQNDLGLSQWYEVVYYDNKWCSYSGSKTFEDGEKVVEWKYCKELL